MIESFSHQGYTLSYTIEGTGPILLFLHGLGGNGENWVLQRKAFAPSHRVVALDLPGHGRSGGRDVSFIRYWEAIEALCDHLNAERIAICGLSKGARAGMMFAARFPDRVERIAVVNAFVHLTPADRQARLALYDLLVQPSGERAWAETLLAAMGVNEHRAIVRGFLKSLDSIDPKHIRARFQELIDFDQRPELADIRCPVLLVRGEQDGFVPPYCVEELHQLLDNSSIARLPHCGHLPYLEDPAAFNALLARFLDATA
ncbi:alpha/beta hydrolase [Sphingomonas sp. H39-1-10]|uniref:alpha/beta fold hydrolase n=1 Tax=Sphingomonadales TaxID=204457 RepID=UPI000C20F592|nr:MULTISPECIES: alpha/beta hydrolase [Sphingomonadaceae]MDF0490077.1 alpha/beta hydrolase [Sphingomonas pollutisoli]PJG45799.1 alpha/beta hydrolase [Sphingobium sp. LB126]